MEVLLYTPGIEESGNRLQSFLEAHVPGRKMDVYHTIEGLAERLRAPHEGEVVAILQANSQEDLSALLSIRHRLQNIKTILLAPDRGEDTIALAHQLHPRFLGYIDNDLNHVASVLEKMMQDHG
jgi:hypothetical protein